jgi:hypothetical protein
MLGSWVEDLWRSLAFSYTRLNPQNEYDERHQDAAGFYIPLAMLWEDLGLCQLSLSEPGAIENLRIQDLQKLLRGQSLVTGAV